MIHYSDPPVLLREVIDDIGDDVRLLERAAPYTPLGGWYRPGIDLDTPSSAMWFQNDWVHADLRVPGSELFLFHDRVMQAARDFYGAEVVVPLGRRIERLRGPARLRGDFVGGGIMQALPILGTHGAGESDREVALVVESAEYRATHRCVALLLASIRASGRVFLRRCAPARGFHPLRDLP